VHGMGRDRMRVLVGAIASLALVTMGALIMDWYRLSFVDVAGNTEKIAINLRHAHFCVVGRVCAASPLTPLPGMFPILAAGTLWSSLGFAALVALQAGARVLTGNVNDAFTRPSYLLALLTISLVAATAFLFRPEPEGPGIGLAAQMGIELQRTWAPLTLLVGHVIGLAVLYMAVAPGSSDLDGVYKPVTLASPVLALGGATAGPTPPVAEPLRHRLSYVAVTAELAAGGIDARREDGSSRLVLWRDVVGVVARRLPPAYGGTTFIDIVSTAGSTLRIMPWTRLTGDALEAADAANVARPRWIVERVVASCPGAKLDPATRRFVETGEAAQLPDLATLHAHDERLA